MKTLSLGKQLLFVVATSLLLLLTSQQVSAAINPQIPFFGTLQDSVGTDLDGTYDMVFRFYDAPTGGTLLDTSTHTAGNGNAVSVSQGEFSVQLGSGTGNALDGVDFNTATIYVGLTVNGDSEMLPRERLGAVAYSFNTELVDGYDSTELLRFDAAGSITDNIASPLLTITQAGLGDIFNVFDGGTEVFSILDGGNIGVGTSSPSRTLSVDGDFELTGALYDRLSSAGIAGMVMQTTGSGVQWVATSSLGIDGGGAVTFGTNGQLPYMSPGGTDFVYSNGLTYNGSTLDLDEGSLLVFGDIRTDASSEFNTFLGVGAGLNNVDVPLETFNTFIGSSAGRSNVNGYNNTAVGSGAFLNPSDTVHNVAIGTTALFNSTGDNDLTNIGSYNVAVGSRSMYNNGTGFENTALGYWSLNQNDTGTYNSAVGAYALGLNTTGVESAAVGYSSAYGNTTGVGNASLGAYSLFSNTTGDFNIAIGHSVAYDNTGSFNTSIGASAGYNNTESYTEFIGNETGARMNAGATVAIGSGALRGGSGSATLGLAASTTNNTAIGYQSGYNLATGADNNILIGYRAADSLTTGANNVIIGYDIEAPSNTTNGQLSIGNLIFGTGLDGTGTTLSSGNIGIGTTSPYAKLAITGDLALTGGIYDNSASLGTTGMVMQTTGTGFQWVATSSLGISGGGGGSSLFTDSGSTAYLTSVSDNLALGTTTAAGKLTIENSTAGLPSLFSGSDPTNSAFAISFGPPSFFDKGENVFFTTDASKAPLVVAVEIDNITDSDGQNTAGRFDARFNHSAGVLSLLQGVDSLVSFDGDGEVTNASAFSGGVGMFGEGTLTQASGINIDNQFFPPSIDGSSLATLGDVYGARILNQFADVQTTNVYGINISTQGAETTNFYGLYIDGVVNTITDDAFGIYVADTSLENYFAGDVGIGTSTPTARLSVDGTVRLSTITGGTLETDALGNVTVSSDERLKDIEGTYAPGLNAVLALNPISYRWNDLSGYDKETLYAGFSAQNVESVIPEAVGENGDGYKTLSTRPILAAVVNAIKSLWASNEEQDERIRSLEERIAELETPNSPSDSNPVTDSEEEEEIETAPAAEDSETPVAVTEPEGAEEVIEEGVSTASEEEGSDTVASDEQPPESAPEESGVGTDLVEEEPEDVAAEEEPEDEVQPVDETPVEDVEPETMSDPAESNLGDLE